MNTLRRISESYLFRNAGITAALVGTGAVSGLVLDALVLLAFGVGSQTDAYLTALTIPMLLSGVFTIQCPKVLIPVFGEYFSRHDDAGAWALLRKVLTTCFLLLAGLCAAGITLSSLVVQLQIPGLDAATVALSVRLSRMLFGLVVFQGLAAIMQSVLYARHAYVVGCSGKLVINVVTILVLLAGRRDPTVELIAGGVLLGNLLQVTFLSVALATHGFRYAWKLDWADPKLRFILGSFRYPLTGHVIGESGAILQNVLGSFLGSGSLTLLRYASRIVQAIAGILLGSVVQVTLPLVAKYAAANNLRLQRKALIDSVQLLILIGLPFCVWLVFAAEPLVMLFFQRGQFTAADAAVTASIIRMMVPDLLLGRIVSITQTLFYANGDQRTPFVSTVIYAVANAAAAITLGRWLGVQGVGLGVSVASLSNGLYMAVKLQRRFAPVGWGEMRAFAGRLALTCTLALGGFALASRALTLTTLSYSLTKVLAVAFPGAAGFVVFIVVAYKCGLLEPPLSSPVADGA
jgi:putative peptidoglycan lipid II flippase